MGGWLNNTRVRFRRVVDSRQTMAVRLDTMMRRPLLQAVLAAVAVSLAIPIALIVTRTLYWTVGVVLPGSCTTAGTGRLRRGPHWCPTGPNDWSGGGPM